jgi:thiol-disulfide isomerase/thioredoxin
MARRRTVVSKKRSRKQIPRRSKGGKPLFRRRRVRKMRMSALNSNPFMIEGAVHMRSPKELREKRTESPSSTMVWIYAEWCGHCHRFLPVWTDLVREFPDMRFVMINGDDSEFSSDYPETYPRVSGYPTLWLMRVGEMVPEEYDQRRDLQTLREVVREMMDA